MSSVALAIAVGAVVLVGIWLLGNQSSLDVASPLRSWLWARDARAMQQRHAFPASVSRAYWNRGEYDRDMQRLVSLGYAVVSENATDGYATPAEPLQERDDYVRLGNFGLGRAGQLARRRIPKFFVLYEFQVQPADGVSVESRAQP